MSVTRVLTMVGFGVTLAWFAALELLARRPGSRMPPFGALCGYLLGYRVGRLPVGRIALLALWWWVGWHFFAR